MIPDESRYLTDVFLYALIVTLPTLVGFAVAYVSPTHRENVARSAAKIAVSSVGCCLLVGSYYLVQYALGNGSFRSDFLGFAAVYGGFLVVVTVYSLVSSAVGLTLGTDAVRR